MYKEGMYLSVHRQAFFAHDSRLVIVQTIQGNIATKDLAMVPMTWRLVCGVGTNEIIL